MLKNVKNSAHVNIYIYIRERWEYWLTPEAGWALHGDSSDSCFAKCLPFLLFVNCSDLSDYIGIFREVSALDAICVC